MSGVHSSGRRALLRAAALLVVILAPACGHPLDERSYPHANLILISLDTLRVDGLSSEGGAPGVSPALDAFARESVVFDHARAAAPHTAPSHMSLFTSLYPSVHGVQNVAHADDPRTPEIKQVPIIYELPESIPTLAEVLHERGFTTLGFTDGGNVNPAHGFYRGFDVYTKALSGVDVQIAEATEWLARRRRPLPGETQIVESLDDVIFTDQRCGRFFMFWHTYEIHSPYVPPRSYVDDWTPPDYQGPLKEIVDSLGGLSFREKWGRMRSQFWKQRDTFGPAEAAYLRGLYDGGVRYTDDLLPKLFDTLKEEGLYDSSIIVVLSDHGEEFHEHGGWQHEQLYEELLRVPLMIRLPGGRGGGTRITTPVSLMDVMPTVLELLGVDEATREGLALEGTSLADAVLGGGEPPARQITSELRWDRPGNPNHDWMVAHYFQGQKLIYDEVRGERVDGNVVQLRQLFDLSSDPTEQHDLSAQGGQTLDRLLEIHRLWRRAVDLRNPDAEMKPGELDCSELRQLIELGYMSGAAAEEALAQCEAEESGG